LKKGPKHKVHDPDRRNNNLKAATALWKPVGIFAFLVSIGVWAAMANESIAPDTLKWSSLDSYAVTLFAVPLLSLTLVAECIIGAIYAEASSGAARDWPSRVPNLLPELEGSVLRNPVAIISLLAFAVLPSFVLCNATAKFFQGKYYYATSPGAGCDPKANPPCESMENYWKHFLIFTASGVVAIGGYLAHLVAPHRDV
jgi:hypothetical protein